MLFAVGQMVGKLRQVIAGQRAVVEAANRGNFDARVDTAGMQGFQKEMGDGLNQLVTTTGASIADVVRVMGAGRGRPDHPHRQGLPGRLRQLKDYSNNTMDKLAQVVGEVNGSAAVAGLGLRRSQRHRAVAVAGGFRAGRRRRGNQRLAGTDDGIDLAEHRERPRHRRHGHQGGARSGRRRRSRQGHRPR
jgi:hypothetical protein